ncbi:membrane protease YdiL (CAAX protease family) [Pseudarthrobacter defluvii]|uniref:CPBP family intramembrane glutamic endopeptidase n=1 Tax=Pseudarthrobacter defluvii TaxID=410837 RepID=UPI0027821B93|nr:CPBP family intramembrane glutamic endopeptidase [Pseudarthrobacter defluvii]MDQ0769413.1 membrane protease YdiL (CAAX protease family) [Pseudarthrobacter defluvii]
MIETQTAAPARPLKAALTLTGITAGLTIAAALVIQWLAPGMEPMQQRFIAVLALAAFAVITVAVTRRDLLTSGRLHPVLLILPLLVSLAPFAGGIKDISPQAGTTVVIGYLATGVYEELWFRGLVLNSLAQWTPVKAALVSSTLFGLTHLSNIAFGANPAITAAQVIGATCFGIGLAALRLRGVSLWPLIIIHALTDIALQVGDVTSTWRWILMIGGDIILLAYGLRILRKASPTGEDHLWPMV